MKILVISILISFLHSTTLLLLHAATCLAVLNKGSPSTLSEASEAGYQYNGPAPQYLPTSLQQGYQYVVPAAHYQSNVASPVYQHTSATQALAVDVAAGPAKAEGETYFVAKDQQKTAAASATVNVNPGYAPPDYHSANYYVPRQIQQEQQQQHLVPQQQTNNVASNHPQDQEYFVERRPDQHSSNGESSHEFTNGYTNNLVTSNRVPQYTSNQQHSNGYVNSQAEDCASSHINQQKENDFQIASQAPQTLSNYNDYSNVRPLYQPINRGQLTTENIDHGGAQTHYQPTTSSLANSHKSNDFPVKPQIVRILPNFVPNRNQGPSYHSVSPAQIPAEQQGHGNVQTPLQAATSGLSLSQPGAELTHHGYNYRYQQPSFNPAVQSTSNSNDFEPQVHQTNNFNENNYVSNAAPTSAASVIYTPSQTHPATHYLSPLHTQVSIATTPDRARPGQIPSVASVPNYAVDHKGLGHYSYTQSSPVAITAKDELLTGGQQQQLVRPSTGGRNYLQMQSQSYELPTYASMHTELPVATDYAKQRIQGSQILTHYAAPLNSNQQLSGLVVPQSHYRVAESVVRPSNTYLPPSDEVKPAYY